MGTLQFSLSALLPQQRKVSPHPIATQISWQTDIFSRAEPRPLHVVFVHSKYLFLEMTCLDLWLVMFFCQSV